METFLRTGVLLLVAWAASALGVEWLRAGAYGRRVLFAPPAGSAWRGVFYAFGPAMSPAAKESVRLHLRTWFAGVVYHLGIACALLTLGALLLRFELPAEARRLAAGFALAGACCGAGLLLKRLLSPHLRGLSIADDFVANLLTTAFVGLAFARMLAPSLEPLFLVESMLLLLYLPLGKIRHCVFFFSTRWHLGAHFGRRGVFPLRHGAGGEAE